MPRKNRKDTVPDRSVHHILQKGLASCKIFMEDRDYEYYIGLMSRYKDKHGIVIYNYCLMQSHIHMLVYVNELVQLSRFVQALSLAYSAYYRKTYGHTGYLWQGRYKNYSVNDKNHLLECARYIERNPVRDEKNPVPDPGKYRWSSYNFYASGAHDKLLTQNPLFDSLGNGPDERRAKYREYISTDRPYEDILDGIFSIK